MERPGSNAGSFSFWYWTIFGAYWLLAFIGLSLHWRINPQYHYGWFVPPLALYAAWNRWRTRPAPGSPASFGLWLVAGMAVAVLPTWLFSQPNPDWAMVNWVFVGELAIGTLGVVAMLGGRPWLRHFCVPVLLVFTAVPWPDTLESPIIQTLMQAVAGIAVALLDLLGVSALQHGNLIEVASGTVGVDEACSGIRSLQGSLMASLVLGEIFRFGTGRRVLLVAASVVTALVTNVIRAGFLAWSAAHSGLEAVGRWHDPAGMTILSVCVGFILLSALFLDRNVASPTVPAWVPAGHGLPRWLVPSLALWLAIAVVAGEAWFYDGAPAPGSPWTLNPPAESTRIELPVSVISQFHADESTAVTWAGSGGSHWLLYFFEWKYGPAFSRIAASMHSPAVCLPAGGREMHEDRGVREFSAGGNALPFHAYSFVQGDKLIFVYHGIWQFRSERGLRHGPLSPYKQVASFQSVLWRERELGQQTAELIVSGLESGAEADAAFQKELLKLVARRSAPASS